MTANSATTVARTYLARNIDFSVLRDLLERFEALIPSDAKRDESSPLALVPRFEVSSFCQIINLESASDFIDILGRGAESFDIVNIRLECHRVPTSLASYPITPPYLAFSWSSTKITVQISRIRTQKALQYLQELEGKLGLEMITDPSVEHNPASSYLSTMVERSYSASEVNWHVLPDLLVQFRSNLSPSDLFERDRALLALPRFELATLSQHVVVETDKQFTDFVRTTQEQPTSVSIQLRCFLRQNDGGLLHLKPDFLTFDWKPNGILLRICRLSSERAKAGIEDFETKLKLHPALSPSPSNSIERKRKRTVFIAHSFDDSGRSNAFQLTKFLNLLGFEVATGEGFSPEGVSSKVRRRLKAQEVVVVVMSKRDDFTWLIQEMTGASFADKPLIVLVEEGVDFKAGILGDLEYIKYPTANVSLCFVPIVEGLRELGFTFR